jgi:hypothetical protein
MAETLDWPAQLRPANLRLALVNSSISGGRSATGREQVVQGPGGIWSLRYSGVYVRNAEQIRAIRALEARLDGRAGLLRLPVYDCFRTRGFFGDPANAGFRHVPHSDGASFSDTTYYRQSGSGAAITLTANAALNATTLAIAWNDLPPTEGLHFSIGDNLYRIARLQPSGIGAGTITIRPWLRTAASSGAALNFATPRVLMRLAQDDGLALDLQLWRRDTLTIDFEEP